MPLGTRGIKMARRP